MYREVAGLLTFFYFLGASLRAEQLPLKLYTAADGLAGDSVQALAEDGRGFLWVGSSTGLSRFDGAAFTTYGVEDGLPHPDVTTLLASRDGTIWVGTLRGLARSSREAHPGRPLFATCRLGDRAHDRVFALLETSDGDLWVGTAGGLLRVSPDCPEAGPKQISLGMASEPEVYSLLAMEGRLFAGSSRGLVERLTEGEVRMHRVWPDARGIDPVRKVALDSRGLLWVIHHVGIFVARYPLAPLQAGRSWFDQAGGAKAGDVWRLPPSAGRTSFLPLSKVRPRSISNGSLAFRRDGAVWVATNVGLLRLDESGWRLFDSDHGLPESAVSPLHSDRHGNLWIGAESRGLARLSATGFVSFGSADGLELRRIAGLFESRHGELMVFANDALSPRLYRFNGQRFEDVTPEAVLRLAVPGWGWMHNVWQDRRGEWWFPSGEGLLRFAAVPASELRGALPLHRFTRSDGLPGNDVFRLYEDRRGDFWLSVLDTQLPLVRYHREQGRFETLPPLPEVMHSAATAFEEDGAGNLWLGFYVGGLARWNEREGFHPFPPGPDVPSGFVYDLMMDRRGNLWAAMSSGAVRIEDPEGTPKFSRYAAGGGLARDSLRALGEDSHGRIYLGSDRGIDRIDPETGAVESFTTGDGLANSNVRILFRDRHLSLWAGTMLGLSRLEPEPPRSSPLVPVVVVGVELAGAPQVMPALPSSRLGGFELSSRDNRIQIDYAGISLAPRARLLYETRLPEMGGEWSTPSPNRSVLLAGLPPGRHRFQVRASAGGAAGGEPAEVSFSVLPPLWRRSWFQAAAGLAVFATAWGGYRYRVGRLLAVERMRTRIASDLHDEVGSSLSRIGILAEVGKLRLGAEGAEAGALLGEIGEISRGLAEAMSDIVWALDPRRDDLPSLVARLRRFASDVLEAQGVSLDFSAPETDARQRLSTGDRRELFLLLKEAIHNAARHARAGRVKVAITLEGGQLTAEVSDDGVGLQASESRGGHGLDSMRRRAEVLGGRLSIESEPGKGTTVRLLALLSARRWPRPRPKA